MTTSEQQNWAGRTKKQKQGRRDWENESGKTQGAKAMDRLQSATKNNRRDTTEQRDWKTTGKAGARKRRSGNKREHATGKTQPGRRRRHEKQIFYETEKEKPGQQREATQSENAVTTKRRRGKRTDKTTELEKTGRRNREEATGGAQPSGCMGHRQKSQNPGTQRGNGTERRPNLAARGSNKSG